MKVNFVMYSCSANPSGGEKVIYEDANYLSQHGHEVHIYYYGFNILLKLHGKIPEGIRRWMIRKTVAKRPGWIKLHSSIQKHTIFSIDDEHLDDADVVFATAVETAEPVKNLSASKGKKFYLVQDFENWSVGDQAVYHSYQLGLNIVTVSHWLENLVKQYSKDPVYCISNAINTDLFKLKNPISARKDHTLVFHYRNNAYKGGRYAIEVVKKLINKYPDLKVTIVSSQEKDDHIPDFCHYVYNASPEQVAQINNEAQVFMCTSVKEGFGLPGLEAMACGCALVTTDFDGAKEYAVNNKNALVSPIKDVAAMYENVIRLFENQSLRLKIAQEGIKTAGERSLERTGEQLVEIISAQ